MTRMLLAILVLGFLADPAGAQLRRMGWGDVGLDHRDASPNCSALPDENTLVASFVATGISDLRKVEGYVDFCTEPYSLPEWWKFDLAGGCHQDSLSLSVDFSSGPFTQLNPWVDGANVSFQFLENPMGEDPSMARIEFTVESKGVGNVPLEEGKEYYAFKLRFGNPDAGCEGCQIGACFVLNGLLLYHSGEITPTEMDFYSNYATWQGGQSDCPFIVPTRQTSWGRLKALYR
jgi:hypothetical protein